MRKEDTSSGSGQRGPHSRDRSDESERLEQPGAGARVTGVHGVGAPDVTDHDVPARKPEEDDSDLPIDNGAGS